MAIYVKGFITESGEIKADLPKEHPVGEVTIIIQETHQAEDVTWTEEELQELLTQKPGTLGDILAEGLVGIGAESMKDMPDSVELIAQRRRERRERRGNWTP